jgi:hypothetical protein
VLIAFARGVRAYWGPMAYCFGCTVLHFAGYMGKHFMASHDLVVLISDRHYVELGSVLDASIYLHW